MDRTVREAPSGRWLLLLAAVVGLGVAVRVAYVLVVLDPVPPGLDAIWYQLQGGSIRNGTGYVVPTSLFRPEQVPTAAFPPAYPVYQAVWQSIFGDGPTSVRLAGIVPATATIALVGLLGRRLVGRRAGLLAAGVVALDPSLVAVDGSAMSENLAVPVVLAIVVVAHRLLVDGVRPHRFVLVGVLSGVAVLTRQDLFLLLVLVGVPAVAWDREPGWRRRVGAVAAIVAVTATVVVPWAWRNEREVGVFAVSTLSPSSALAGSNCDDTYAGTGVGSWSFPCVVAAVPPGEPGEVEVADAQQSAGLSYVRAHVGRLPAVLAARQARVWGFWDPRDLARRDTDESRRYGWQLLSRPVDAAMTVIGVTGLVLLARRRRPDRRALVVFAPLVVVAVSATIGYGNPRFNAVAHPMLALGIAVMVDMFLRRLRPTDSVPSSPLPA